MNVHPNAPVGACTGSCEVCRGPVYGFRNLVPTLCCDCIRRAVVWAARQAYEEEKQPKEAL